MWSYSLVPAKSMSLPLLINYKVPIFGIVSQTILRKKS